MADSEPHPPSASATKVTFVSDGLLSKWGFADGDLLLEFMNANGFDVAEHSHGDLLVAAVERFVLPYLEQRVEVEVVSSMHNPIRAVRVDGVAVDPLQPESNKVRLRPAEVHVSRDVLVELAQELFGPPGKKQ
jgi:hypothetical protein